MSMSIGEYIDLYGEDPRDRGDENATCRGCGNAFHVTWHGPTRVDPACPDRDTCPDCGSDDVEFE